LLRRWKCGDGTCQQVLKEGLGMRTVAAKFVPRILTADQKQQCTDVCTELRQLPHPQYSPDLATCGFFLFPKMKLKLKGCQFDTTEEIQAKMQTVLDTLTETDHQESFQKWRRRDWCLHSGGNYFEVNGGR
jgi:hypothetical protein